MGSLWSDRTGRISRQSCHSALPRLSVYGVAPGSRAADRVTPGRSQLATSEREVPALDRPTAPLAKSVRGLRLLAQKDLVELAFAFGATNADDPVAFAQLGIGTDRDRAPISDGGEDRAPVRKLQAARQHAYRWRSLAELSFDELELAAAQGGQDE